MATALKRKEKSDKQLFTGFFTGQVKAVNPSKSELEELLGSSLPEDMEEIKYSGTDKNNNEYIALSFWLQADTVDKQWFNARFRLVDKVQQNKDGTKTQYVSQTGGSSWSDSEKNLLDWFTHYQKEEVKGSGKYVNVADKEIRAAIQGEANLYVFLRAWLAKVDWYSTDTNLFSMVDVKKMFRNIDKFVNDEYRPLLKLTGDEALTGPVCALATVYTGEKDGNVVHYQNLYQLFMGGYQMKKINAAISTGNWTNDKGIKKIYDDITGAHGCKDAFTLTLLQPFNPEEHIQSSNDTIRIDNNDVSDTDY